MKYVQKIFLVLLITCGPFVLFAQNQTVQKKTEDKIEDKDKKDEGEIKTLLSDVKHHGGFISFSVKTSSLNKQLAIMPGFRLAWVMNRKLALGIEGYGLAPTIRQDAFFSSQIKVRPLFGYGGFFIEPIINSNKAIHFTFPLMLGTGWAGYVDDWSNDWSNGELREEQLFWVLEPAANLEANLTRRLRFTLGASYRMTKELNLLNANKKDFNGLSYNFAFKLGIF